MVLFSGTGIDLTSRIAGAPSPRSTVCFSEKFANGQRTRRIASASVASFLIVISSGRSIPTWSDAGTRALITCSASPAAAKPGVSPRPATRPATRPSARNRDLPDSAAHPTRSRAPLRLNVATAVIDYRRGHQRLTGVGRPNDHVVRNIGAILPRTVFLFVF